MGVCRKIAVHVCMYVHRIQNKGFRCSSTDKDGNRSVSRLSALYVFLLRDSSEQQLEDSLGISFRSMNQKKKRKEGVILLVLMPTCPIFNYPSHPLSLGCSEMPTNKPWENFKGLDALFWKLDGGWGERLCTSLDCEILAWNCSRMKFPLGF